MKQLSKSNLIIFFTFSLLIIFIIFYVGIYAVVQRQNNYDVSINISPNLFYSIEIAKVKIEVENIDLQAEIPIPIINENTEGADFPKWVKIFDNFNHNATPNVNIIDGKIVFPKVEGVSTFETLLDGPLTSEDVLFFRITNLTLNTTLKCELANTGSNGYSFTTSETRTIGDTEYVLANVENGQYGVFYVYSNAWYQNMVINFPLDVSVDLIA